MMSFKSVSRGQRQYGFTLTEILLVLLVLVIFALAIVPPKCAGSSKSKRTLCFSYLKEINLAFRVWAYDKEEKLPWQVPIAQGGSKEYLDGSQTFWHFLVLSNQLRNPKIFSCYTDAQRPPTTNWNNFSDAHLSYFIGLDADTTKPQTILLGDRSISTNGHLNSGLLSIAANQKITWAPGLHDYGGNIGFSDGSVQQFYDGNIRFSDGRVQQLSGIAFSNAFRVLIP